MNKKTTNTLSRKLCALLLALSMLLPLVPAGLVARAAYSDSAMDKLVSWGVLTGYPDGQLHPERNLTRAEFVAMVNRAFGYKKTGPTPFTDVPETSWYSDDIGIGYNAGYFTGMSPRLAAPSRELTREEAVVLLGRNMRLDPIAGEVTEFTDGRDFSNWSRGYARAATQEGMINGYGDGTYRPRNSITRGEMAVMLTRAMGTLIHEPGVHTLSDVYGNVTINSPNTVLRDSTIAGDLYITGGLDLGDVRLENVKVLGQIIIAGGGESQSGESIQLCNVEADSIKIDSLANQYVSLAAEGNTVVGETQVRSDAYIQDRTRPGEGFLNIVLDSDYPGAQFTLSGNLENVVNMTPNSLLTVAMGTVDTLTVDEYAQNSTLNLDVGSTVMTLNLDTAATVMGVGDIDHLYVNAPGTNVSMLPDTITIRPGLTSQIAGQTMDTQQANESSADPRLLAGYPKVRNIAPTSATAVFSANKGGTVYWAISTTTDGSIGEDELVSPTSGNRRIQLNGSTPIEQSNTEYNASLEKLTPDSNYYISTVMVDARGRHSPVKVASFTTPDNTDPAFTKGYPLITQNDYYYKPKGELYELDANGNRIPVFRAQVSGMPNKNCQVYYALYLAGSAEPTGQQFRTGALGKVVQSGVEDVSKNEVWRQTFKGLEELTDYDLYLWLCDADGARSSKVYKLTFKTADGTPPRFQYETPNVSGNPPATSIPTRANMDEDCTVYWVAVKHGDDYIRATSLPKDLSDLADVLDYLKGMANGKWTNKSGEEVIPTAAQSREISKLLDTFKRKVESGSGGVRNGQARVRKDADTSINITGLQPETAYDIYYVAKDAAGNYSDVKVITERTLDVTPPTVTQEFTLTNEKGQPYADTGINLIFSEDIQLYRSATDGQPENPVTLSSFSNVKDDPDRKAEMADFLSKIITFYNDSSENPNEPLETRRYILNDDGTWTASNDPWVIDFRQAQISQDPDSGKVTVFLPSKSVDGVPVGALNLNSDATYHFVIRDVQDLATTPNRIRPMPYPLPTFHTIAAQVQLRKDVSDATISALYVEKDGLVPGTDVRRPSLDKNDRGVVAEGAVVNNDYKYVFIDEYGNEHATEDPLAIDMSFSLRPVSVSVNQDMRWDMIFWSNTPVEFEVYRRERDGNGVWEKLSETGRSWMQPDSTHEFAGKGLTYLRHRPEQPYIRPEMTGKIGSYDPLETDKVYEYAIHFTKVGNVREYVEETDGWSTLNGRETWDADIEFRINVISGMGTTPFSLLANGAIYYDHYATMQRSHGAQEINTTDPGSEYFTLYKPFAVQRAPVFTNGNPVFRTEDIGAEINVTTDRAGTVYWVVAPFTRRNATSLAYEPVLPPQIIGNTIAAATIPVDEVDRYAAYTYPDTNPPSEGATLIPYLIPYRGSTDARKLCLVDRPYPDEIYNPSITSDRIRVGSTRVTGSGMVTIKVDDLDPATSYFAYFVLQSEGKPIYSEKAYLFQFWTEAVSRPKLVIEGRGSATVEVKSKNMDANANYAVFLMTGLPDELDQKFWSKDVLGDNFNDPKVKAALNQINPAITAEGSTFKVYDALATLRDGGTIYDEYASTAHKDALLKLITKQTYSPGLFDISNATLKQDVFDNVNCQEKYGIQPNQDYLFIAAAVSPRAQQNQGPDSYGFGAYQPVHIEDTTPPKINSYDGRAYVNLKDDEVAMGVFTGTEAKYPKVASKRMSGQFDLTFDKDLYLYKDIKNRLPFVESSETDPGDYVAGTNAWYKDFGTANNNPDFDVIAVSESGSTNVRTVTLRFRNLEISKSSTFSANVNLVSYYSSPNTSDQLKLTLHYDKEMQYVTVTASSSTWYESLVMYLPTEVEEPDPPVATGINLSPTSLKLAVGEESTVTATLFPVGAVGDIYWVAEPTDTPNYAGEVMIDPNPGNKVTITGVSAGTVKITAYTMDPMTGARVLQATCTVTITDVTIKIIKEGDPSAQQPFHVKKNQHIKLWYTASSQISVASVTWQSYDPSVSVTMGTLANNWTDGGDVTGIAVTGVAVLVRVTVVTTDNKSYSADCYIMVDQ